MTDYISREAFIAHLRNDPLFDLVDCYGIVSVIKAFPAADVRPVVKAAWIVKEVQALFPGMDEHPVFVCSECGYQIYDLLDSVKERHHFCPNCGSWMEES